MIWLRRLFRMDLSAKDPNDSTLTWNSTQWHAQEFWCKCCKTDRGYSERMSHFCDNCGTHYSIVPNGCSIRRIWNGKKWIRQYNEGIYGTAWTDDSRAIVRVAAELGRRMP